MRRFLQAAVCVAACLLGDRVVFSADKDGEAADGAKGGKSAPLLEEGFEKGMKRWEVTDAKEKDGVWEIVEVKGEDGKPSHVLRVKGKSKYEPPHRSPHSIAWLKGVKVGDFELSAKVQNTNPTAGAHRDLCFFWGYQDPAHFYYVHLGAQADPHACQIFIVNDAPRIAITKQEAKGTPWTDGWHNVKVVRKGSVAEVYFDDMKKPLMTADDKTFGAGLVGIGTFDDSGNFDEVVLKGVPAEGSEVLECFETEE